MRAIVADPSFLLPALFRAGGHRRRLLVVFAYGALSFRVRSLAEEFDLIEDELQRAGATAGGPSIERFVEEAGARKARMEEFLPPMTPDDLYLAGARHLFDEIELKANDDYWKRDLPDFDGDLGPVARRQLVSLTPVVVPDFDPFGVQRFTADRKDDYLIHTALVADAFAVLSDDRRHVSTSEGAPTMYGSAGNRVGAYQFASFIEEHVNTLHFDLGDVDGRTLALAHELLQEADQGS
jgi:hypothetical protein